MKSPILFILLSLILPVALSAQVVINEFSASNLHFHEDGYGDYSDYIELYNTTGAPLDISGYYLSDNLTDPTKWQVPAGVVIPANGFELFYPSAKLTTQFDGQHYHLPFQLTQTQQEEVVLSDPTGTVIDSVLMTMPTQMNHSRGRTTDGGPDWGVMTEPTPGASNFNVFDDYTQRPVFDLPPGFYTGAQTVSLSITDPTHIIRYTTDGTKPDWTSPVYSGPITVNNSMTVRARAFPPGGPGGGTSGPYCDEPQGSAGFPNDLDCQAVVCAADPFCCNNTWDALCAGDAAGFTECFDCLTTYVPPPPAGTNVTPGFTETNTYFIDETYTVPTIAVSGQLGQWNAGGGGGWMQVNGNWHNHYEVCLEYFDTAGIFITELEGTLRRHGNDSWAYPQRGMRFHSRDQQGFDNNVDYELFPQKDRGKYDVVIMKAAGSDNYPGNGWLPTAHLRDGFAQTASQRGELELDERSYNHQITYLNGDYWGLYETRERIDKDFTDHYYNQPEEFVDMLEYWGGLEEEYGNDDDWVLLYNFVTGNDMSVQLNYDYVTTQLNPESFIDNFVLNTYFVNTDWLNWNTKWWRGTFGTGVRWRYVLWDLDNTFNLGQNYTGWSSTGPYVNVVCEAQSIFQNWGSSNGHTAMYSSLLDNEGFFQAYINRYADLLNTALHCDTLVALLDEFEANMLPEMPGQVNRWGGNVGTWQNRVEDIREFICIRWDIVNQQIIDCFEDDYDISGPYEVTVVIVGPGNVNLNTITITAGPWTGTYFGGLDLGLTAVPLANGEFIEWSLNNNFTGQNLQDLNLGLTLNENDTIYAYFNFVDPLPVEWLSFDGEVVNRWGELEWATATETNSSHFEVQRSADALEFRPIGEVGAAGNSSSENRYNFTDKSLPEGIQYYRLKQIDFNGDFEYSNTIALDYGQTTTALLVAPNPNRGAFNVVNQSDQDIEAELLSPHSQHIRNITIEAGRTNYVALEDVSSGIYLLRYVLNGENCYHKIAVH